MRWRKKNNFVLPVICNILFIVVSETEGFKIDTMGTYHGMTLKSVTVRSKLCCFYATLQVDFSLSTSGKN